MLLWAHLALLGSSTPALAGGAFAHTGPVMTHAEQRYFIDRDPVAQTVTMHIEITKDGYPRAEYGWFFPVPALPTFEPSSSALFDLLQAETGPRFTVDHEVDGVCADPPQGWTDTGIDSAVPGVTVIGETTVGPFETVILQATHGTPLVTWLGNHGYAVNGHLGPALVPYLGSGHYLVAMRLRATDDARDELPPIAITWAGEPQIPLRLTAMSAVDDMRVDVWMVDEHRVIPDNYLHVELDPLGIDWLDEGSNLPDLLASAVDEAGGQAFTTLMAEDPAHLSGRLLPGGDFDVHHLYGLVHPISFMEEWLDVGLPITQEVRDVWADHLPVPWHLQHLIDTPDVFYNCLPCYAAELSNTFIDPVALADDLEVRVIAPMRRAETLFASGQTLTRLTTVMSAAEMSVDPTFTTHPRLPDVPRERLATLTWTCDPASSSDAVPRELEVDGRTLDVPSEADLAAAGGYGSWLAQSPRPALRVEDMRPRAPSLLLREQGQPVVADTAWVDTHDTGPHRDTGHSGGTAHTGDTGSPLHTASVVVDSAVVDDTGPPVDSGPGDSLAGGTDSAVQETDSDSGGEETDNHSPPPTPEPTCGCRTGVPGGAWLWLVCLFVARRRVRDDFATLP